MSFVQQPGLRCKPGTGDEFYDFSRLGVRVPAFVVSPWVPKGMIQHGPTGAAKPQLGSQFTHSSISRTLHDLFGLSRFLSERDAWAASFAPLLLTSSTTLRTDTPKTLPVPPALSIQENMRLASEHMQPLNDWQVSLIRGAAAMTGLKWDGNLTHPFGIKTEAEGAVFMRTRFDALVSKSTSGIHHN